MYVLMYSDILYACGEYILVCYWICGMIVSDCGLMLLTIPSPLFGRIGEGWDERGTL